MQTEETDSDLHHRLKFNTTRWSVVLRVRELDSVNRRNAWEEIVKTYWYPLYAFCRRKGASVDKAKDFTQGFFAHLLSGNGLDSVTPTKGLFRTFLLTSFSNYVANQNRAEKSVQRGGRHVIVSLESVDMEARYSLESTRDESPERAYERNWAESLLARVKVRLSEEYERGKKSLLFSLLQPFLANRNSEVSRAEIGSQLQVSQDAVNMAIHHRMRRRYGELLLEEIAATVEDPNDVDDELNNLMEIVSAS